MKRAVSQGILLRHLTFHSDAPQLPGLLSVLVQLTGPSAWGRDWGSEWLGMQGLGNRWEGGGLLSPERKPAALKGRKAVAHRKGVCRVPELSPSPRFL